MFVGTVYGQGETAIIVASGIAGGPSRWQPFVDEIDTEKFTVITYAYTQFTADGAIEETGLILNLLRESGYQRVICVGMSLGVTSCGSISDEPEIIGMVLVAGPENAAGQHDGNCYCESLATSTYPKLFIAGADDQYAADTQQLYEQASEPKTLKLYPGNAYRAAHLLESKDGEDILAQLLGFIDSLS
jgi:esterase/lipase